MPSLNSLLSFYVRTFSSQKCKTRGQKKFLREVEGVWIKGAFQSNDGVDGQGCSTVLQSFVGDGERVWNPQALQPVLSRTSSIATSLSGCTRHQ